MKEDAVDHAVAAGPKKEVVVMGPSAFTAHLEFLQKTIRDLEWRIEYLMNKAKDIGSESGAKESKNKLATIQGELSDARTKMDGVTAHVADVKAKWRKVENRVIGHVVWAPPIVAVPPHQYLQDVCVIKLDQEKFLHFKGNVLSLGAFPPVSQTCSI